MKLGFEIFTSIQTVTFALSATQVTDFVGLLVDCIELSELACSRKGGANLTLVYARLLWVSKEKTVLFTFDQITFTYLLTRKNSHYTASIPYAKLSQHYIVLTCSQHNFVCLALISKIVTMTGLSQN